MDDSDVTPPEPVGDDFDALLRAEGVIDPEVFRDVETFDELPLYSRYHQLGFPDALPVVERNRRLVQAAVRHLDRIRGHFAAHPGPEHVLRLVSVTGWWVDDGPGGRCDDGTSHLLVPHFWIGNLDDARVRNFRLHRPVSRCADFIAGIVGSSGKAVFESRLDGSTPGCPARVYIGFREDVPSGLVA